MDPPIPISGPSSCEGAPPAKRVRKKNVLDSWLEIPEFTGWLQAVQDDPTKAFCTCCQKKVTCGERELKKHAISTTHVKSRALAMQVEEPAVEPDAAHKISIKSAEIKLAAFYAEHNIPIQTVDHLVPLVKDIFKDSRIAQDVTLGRTKCTQLITNCLGARELEKLTDNLKIVKFSVLVDESTDITDTKTLCVLVQFVSPQTKLVVTELLELVELHAADCTADNVYAAFKSCLESKGVPITNIVGMASDNASVMTGVHHSFMTHLKSEVPGLIVLNCICHSSVLIAGKACSELPRSCEELIRNIATYVSGSAKRCAALQEFQILLDAETRKILKLSDTRWLSMQKCVTRLLENWDALKMYFAYAINEDKLKSAETILSHLSNDTIKAYLLFLKYSLNFFNSFNALFQSRKVLVHKLTENSRLLVMEIGSNFLKQEVLKNLAAGTLNVSHPVNFRPLEQVILGPECEQLLREFPSIHAQPIRQACLQFYVTAVTEMQKRLPLKPSALDDLRFLDPRIALNIENRGSVRDLSVIAARFGEFDLTKLAFEWNTLPFAFAEEKKKELLTLDVDAFWKEVASTQSLLDEKMFESLEKLVNIVLSLPHSNAEAERIFSIVTDVKTKKRNKISHKCLNAICQIRSAFHCAGVDCRSFEVEPQHLELHCSESLYSSQQPDEVYTNLFG